MLFVSTAGTGIPFVVAAPYATWLGYLGGGGRTLLELLSVGMLLSIRPSEGKLYAYNMGPAWREANDFQMPFDIAHKVTQHSIAASRSRPQCALRLHMCETHLDIRKSETVW